jgi:DNA-binding response OmpR family regulator
MRDVLLVEDSPTIRHLLVEALDRRGFRIEIVEHGAEVLEAARRLLPTVIVMNRMLPGRDGLDLLAEMRADPAVSSVRVMMLTDSDSREDVLASLARGADDYVIKPFDPEDVARRVETLVRKAQTA